MYRARRRLDREKQDTFSFEVRATDGGEYDTRSRTAHVRVLVGDANDNRPVFDAYPFEVRYLKLFISRSWQ